MVAGVENGTKRNLRDLPKAHLHVHLEGAMRPTTLRALCERNGDPVPATSAAYTTFADFQQLYVAARTALRSPDDLVQLVEEVIEDAADDGAVWIEPAINLVEHHAVGDPDAVLELLVATAGRASARTGVGVGWLVTVDRTKPVDDGVIQAGAAARYAGRGVSALGLANDEAACAPDAFAAAFKVARSAGLVCAPHAGEHGGPDSVRGALDHLGATRIQHGVRAVEDDDLVRRLADQGVCLDVCPTSNVAMGVVPELGAHPLPALMAAGVPCSINADDPLLFGVGLLDEYVVCRERLGLGDDALAACARNSITHSAAPDAVKSGALRAIEEWLAA
jgi:adenosine deaminase